MDKANAFEALFPGPRRQILSAVFSETERWWTLAELAGRAGVQPASVRRHIAQLRHGGILCQKEEDGRAFVRADNSCPVFAELQAIVTKFTQASANGETILVVEDQPATAQITRILLESWGYRVLEAHSAGEAIGIFDQRAEEIQLLLTDVIMPGLSGPQLAEEVLRRHPSLRVVFMSGCPNDELAGRNCAFLPKPFNPASLSKMIRRELDRHEVRQRAY